MPAMVLSQEAKIAIVTMLASYVTPTRVAKRVLKDYAVEASPQLLSRYDPTTYNGKKLAQKWKDLFWQTRKAFDAEAIAIPIASRHYRLQELQDLSDNTEAVAMRLKILEAASKEVNGFYKRPDPEAAGEGGNVFRLIVTGGLPDAPAAEAAHQTALQQQAQEAGVPESSLKEPGINPDWLTKDPFSFELPPMTNQDGSPVIAIDCKPEGGPAASTADTTADTTADASADALQSIAKGVASATDVAAFNPSGHLTAEAKPKA